MNFKKLNKKKLQCSLKCVDEETQFHIFQSCRPILDKLGLREVPQLSLIYGSHGQQKEAIEVFSKIDDMRKQLILQLGESQENLSPGGADARTQAV